MASFKLNINGEAKQVDVPPDMPLLWVLRDVLGLTGSKYGCGVGVCGCCSVLVDGEAERSCTLSVAEVGTKKVITVEGLGKNGLSKLQKAWVEHDVPQCGYCQAGQLISATALLKKKPRPTDSDIDEAMSGNVCRCGTYQRIRQAIHEAAK